MSMFSSLFGEAKEGDGSEAKQGGPSDPDSVSDVFGSVLGGLQAFGSKIAERVESVADHALSDFNKEQQQFLLSKSKAGREAALPPWAAHEEEDTLKERILALSKDKRNFLRDPPPGSRQFDFDFDLSFPVAQAILQEDEELDRMRFDLVPKHVSEFNFWRNYFYRVTLIKQSLELDSAVTVPSTAEDPGPTPAAQAPSSSLAAKPGPEVEVDVEDDGNLSDASFAGDGQAALGGAELSVELDELDSTAREEEAQEIDADTATSEEDTVKVTIRPAAQTDSAASKSASDSWEQELEDELDDYELNEDLENLDLDGDVDLTAAGWEDELEDLLDDEP